MLASKNTVAGWSSRKLAWLITKRSVVRIHLPQPNNVSVAQWIERLPPKEKVGGSIPLRHTKQDYASNKVVYVIRFRRGASSSEVRAIDS